MSRSQASVPHLPCTLGTRAAKIALALRQGSYVSDAAFDRLLPQPWQAVSGHYWTPLEVAVRAAHWIDLEGVQRVVDLGSGAGKFCVIAAMTSRARFVGVEHRAALVETARTLALRLRVADRVDFLLDSIDAERLPQADLYYLFNPFAENFYGPDECLDTSVELNDARFDKDVRTVEWILRSAPIGTRLLTYNGFGGNVPPGYVETYVDRELPCVLRLWSKTTESHGATVHSIFRPGRR